MRAFLLPLSLLALGCPEDTTPTPVDSDTGTTPIVDTDSGTVPDTDTTTTTDPPLPALFRAIHSNEAYGPAEFYVDGASKFVLPPLAATPFGPIGPGSHQVVVAPEGAPPADAGVHTDLSAKESERITLVPLGPADDATLVWANQDLAGLGADSNRLWLVHGAYGGPSFSVIDMATSATLATDLAYGAPQLVDNDAANLTLGVDIGNDGVDWTYTVAGNPTQAFLPLVFTYSADKVPVLVLVTVPPNPPMNGGAMVIQPTAPVARLTRGAGR